MIKSIPAIKGADFFVGKGCDLYWFAAKHGFAILKEAAGNSGRHPGTGVEAQGPSPPWSGIFQGGKVQL
jgi:hypothetical protein